MNKKTATYVDLDGAEWDLARFDLAERKLLSEIQKIARACERASASPLQRWCDFDNAWLPKIVAFYKARNVSHKHVVDTDLFRIAHDLSGRLAVALGIARKGDDYQDRLREIIARDFKTSRAFCKATGLSEDMLSHVLAGRKDLSMEALTKALDRIGYTIRFVPREQPKPKSA